VNPAEFDRLWRATPIPATAAETAVCATGVEVGGFDLVVAHDHLGRRHFLVPFGKDETFRASHRGAGMRATAPRPLLRDGASHMYLDVVCTRPELHGIFCRVAAELLTIAQSSADEPARRCEETLRQWRELFGSRKRGLGPEQLVGLIGELFMVERLAQFNPVGALAYWTGPLGGIHDFRRGNLALEVKTTLRHHGLFFTVSGIDQLEEPPGGQLAVAALRFERVPEGNLTIATLMRRIEAARCDPALLRERLSEVGYILGESPDLDAEAFELRDSRIYAVTPQFPRIIRSSFGFGMLPPGVLSVNYDIDLTSAPPHPLDSATSETWIREFMRP
jgi:hypothetical protein